MAEGRKIADNYQEFLNEVKKREKWNAMFLIPLANDLFALTTETYQEIEHFPGYVRKQIMVKAFFRVCELNDFMMARLYDGEEDENADVEALKLPQPEDLQPGKYEFQKIPLSIEPGIHQEFQDFFSGNANIPNRDTDFLYQCFVLVKKELWDNFSDQICNFGGNTILCMNEWAFTRMWHYTRQVKKLLGKY